MILVRLRGGLGNQLFQFAAGLSLARRLSSRLRLDISSYALPGQRSFSLGVFDLESNGVCDVGHQLDLSLFHKIARLLGRSGIKVFREDAFSFDEGFLGLEGKVILDGYWQSEKYFSNCSEELREILTIRKPISLSSSLILKKIEESNSTVAVHVRRGDYVSSKLANSIHGTCTSEYYREAVRVISDASRAKPRFFIFSDDIDWAENNLHFPHDSVFVRRSGGVPDWEDLLLMTRCSSNIIANSSFSWWAAWLNPNPEKVVVAPKLWFKDDTKDTADLLPESWLKV